MERRFLEKAQANVTVETRADGKQQLVGYGAVYYDASDPGTEYVLWDDAYGRATERIVAGAFDGVLTRPDDVRGLFNHDANLVLGRTLSKTMSLSVDSRGLKYTIDPAKTSTSKDVQAHVSRGDVTGSSFAFSIPPEGQRWTATTDGDGKTIEVREILAAIVYDCGPVTFPAYEGTTAGMRSQTDVIELRKARDAERAATDDGSTDRLRKRLELAEKV